MPGMALPSSRGLAEQLGLSRGVIVEAYEQLVAEGYLTSTQGGATRVSETVAPPPAPSDRLRQAPPSHRFDFRYGRPDLRLFPREVWLRSLRRVLAEAPSERLSYIDHRGVPELRDALATYLNRVRGTAASADQIVITNGFAQALWLVVRVLANTGRRRIGIEDPGQDDVIHVAAQLGAEAVPIPVDGAGIDIDELERAGVDAVVVTPAHQFPTGAVLSAERRAALVAWAKRRDAVILEDEYDAEHRYDREPIGAIHGLARERVIYAGTASKTLAPGLRLGWLALPEEFVEPIADAKEAADRGSPSIEQLAFADFLARGEFDHHLRRMRPIYRARRDALLAALARYLPDFRATGASAGLHVVTWLPDGVDEAELIARARKAGVGLYGVAKYRQLPHDGPGALLFGYGGLTETDIEEGIRIVAGELSKMPAATAAAPG